MNPALWAALGATAAVLLVLVGVGLATVLGARRRGARDDAALASAREDVGELRAQVEELTSALATAQGAAAVARPQVEYVITDAGTVSKDLDLARVPDRAVLSVTLGEPLLKAAALGYGLRRALSAESRNRIAFAMRREVKRARKERRRAARRARVHEARTATAEEAA
jgi:hypothetical protein